MAVPSPNQADGDFSEDFVSLGSAGRGPGDVDFAGVGPFARSHRRHAEIRSLDPKNSRLLLAEVAYRVARSKSPSHGCDHEERV